MAADNLIAVAVRLDGYLIPAGLTLRRALANLSPYLRRAYQREDDPMELKTLQLTLTGDEETLTKIQAFLAMMHYNQGSVPPGWPVRPGVWSFGRSFRNPLSTLR